MEEPLTSPKPTGPQTRPGTVNDVSLYVQGVPAWWNPNWKPSKNPDQISKVAGYLETLCGVEAFRERPITGLLLYGPASTGKTSAGIHLLYLWGQSRRLARFQDFGELMIRIRSSWRKDAKQTVEDIHEEMLKPSILMLDDIGKRAAPEDQETISILINSRLNRQRPTICTTNCDLDTDDGRREFYSACDSRVAERYTGSAVGFKGNSNLRRI